jgi:hypothetical protein
VSCPLHGNVWCTCNYRPRGVSKEESEALADEIFGKKTENRAVSFFKAEDFADPKLVILLPDEAAGIANAKRDAELERLRAENATLQSKYVNGIEVIAELRREMKRMQYVIDQGANDVAEIRRLREALAECRRQIVGHMDTAALKRLIDGALAGGGGGVPPNHDDGVDDATRGMPADDGAADAADAEDCGEIIGRARRGEPRGDGGEP